MKPLECFLHLGVFFSILKSIGTSEFLAFPLCMLLGWRVMHHSKTMKKGTLILILTDGVIHNSKLTGDNSKLTGDDYGNKFLHLVNSDDCGDSIFLD